MGNSLDRWTPAVALLLAAAAPAAAYSATGDGRGQALWWGAIGGMLGGLIGASAVEEEQP